MAYALVNQIPAGKVEALRNVFSESLGPRKAEYQDMQRRSGITEEAYWIQSGPDGDYLIVVSNRDQDAFMEIMADPQTDYDRWFRQQMEEIFEFDFDAPTRTENELIGSWP